MAVPSIGRIVHYTLKEDENDINGARVFPAIITAVHGQTMVNLRLFVDSWQSTAPEWRTSVDFKRGEGQHDVWEWPPRVE